MVKMWHGGAPGRSIGDELLPPVATWFKRTSRVINGPRRKGFVAAYRTDMVYATTDREFAEVWALLYSQDADRVGAGLVYEVELESPKPDDDLSSFGTSFQARRGRIIGVGTPVTTSESRLNDVLIAYQERGREINERRRAEEAEVKASEKLRRSELERARRERRANRAK